MANQHYKKKLIKQLVDILSGEINLSRDVIHYIDSTLAPASGDQLVEFLMDPDNCEAETAVELIFFPDEAMQEKIEPILAQTGFSPEDQTEIANLLCSKNLQVKLCFPDHQSKVPLTVPESAIRQLIARLQLHRRINPQVSEVIDRFITDTRAARRVRVKLRNARIEQSGKQADFLCSLVQTLYGKSDEFWNSLDFAIDLMEQTDPEADMYEALMAHKQFLIKAIRTAEKNQRALQSNTVEALIMRGINISSVNTEEARNSIDRIDRISISIYGKTEFLPGLEPSEQSIDLDIRNKEDIASVLRLLT